MTFVVILTFSIKAKNEDEAVALTRGGRVIEWPIVPYENWPMWAKGLKMMSKVDDRGIGDVVKRMIGEENSVKFQKWYKSIFGKDCGCSGRQARWNSMYPL